MNFLILYMYTLFYFLFHMEDQANPPCLIPLLFTLYIYYYILLLYFTYYYIQIQILQLQYIILVYKIASYYLQTLVYQVRRTQIYCAVGSKAPHHAGGTNQKYSVHDVYRSQFKFSQIWIIKYCKFGEIKMNVIINNSSSHYLLLLLVNIQINKLLPLPTAYRSLFIREFPSK